MLAGGEMDAATKPLIDAPNSVVRNASASPSISATRSPRRNPASRSARPTRQDAAYTRVYGTSLPELPEVPERKT